MELLSVLLVIGILITLSASVVGLVQRKAQQQRAVIEATALVQAAQRFHHVYGCWPREQSRSNRVFFVAGVGSTNLAAFGTWNSGDSELDQAISAPDVDLADILAAMAPNSPDNPRGILFHSFPTNSLVQGRLVDPWGNPYLLIMDSGQICSFQFGAVAFSNVSAVAISAGPPTAAPSSANWCFSAGVKP
jgi:hypothetical protein